MIDRNIMLRDARRRISCPVMIPFWNYNISPERNEYDGEDY